MRQKNDCTRRGVSGLLAVLTVLFVFGATLTNAQIAQGGSYKLEQAVIAAGGGTSADSTGSLYKLDGVIGEPIAGTTSRAGTFSLRGGFLTAAPLAPTAAPVFVAGRVLTLDGGGLVNARVTLTDASGAARTVLTKARGRFRFNDLEAGRTYVISVAARRYVFAPQIVVAIEDLNDLIFNAVGQAGGAIFRQ